MTGDRATLLERLELARGRVMELKNEDVGAMFPDQIPAEIRVALTAYTEAVCDYLGSCFFVMDRLGEGLFREVGDLSGRMERDQSYALPSSCRRSI